MYAGFHLRGRGGGHLLPLGIRNNLKKSPMGFESPLTFTKLYFATPLPKCLDETLVWIIHGQICYPNFLREI